MLQRRQMWQGSENGCSGGWEYSGVHVFSFICTVSTRHKQSSWGNWSYWTFGREGGAQQRAPLTWKQKNKCNKKLANTVWPRDCALIHCSFETMHDACTIFLLFMVHEHWIHLPSSVLDKLSFFLSSVEQITFTASSNIHKTVYVDVSMLKQYRKSWHQSFAKPQQLLCFLFTILRESIQQFFFVFVFAHQNCYCQNLLETKKIQPTQQLLPT